MRFIKERLAESGGFNIVLILVALLFRCINLTNPSIFVKVDAVF